MRFMWDGGAGLKEKVSLPPLPPPGADPFLRAQFMESVMVTGLRLCYGMPAQC